MSVKETCAAIGRYYKSLDTEYNGELSTYCEENGYEEDDDFITEMDEPAADCGIVEFADENFPFKNKPQDEDDKNLFVYNLIKKCMANPNIPFDIDLDFTKFGSALAQVKEKDLANMRKLYAEQCTSLHGQDWNTDEGLLRMLAVGNKENCDYLLHLVDDFNRWRVQKRDDKFLKGTTAEWSDKHGHFEQMKNVEIYLEKEQRTVAFSNLASSAVNGFGNRICPKFQFKKMKLIDDSYETVVGYIHNAVNFVWNLTTTSTKEGKIICPFQMDFCIAIGACIQVEDDDDDDGDDDDDDDDDDGDDGDDEKDEIQGHQIGDIKAKLVDNKLKYSVFDKNASDTTRFPDLYDKFVKENKLKGSGKDSKYLHQKRLIMMIDRRVSKKDVNKPDHVWIYEPPSDCQNISNQAPPEWYIDSSVKCLLPQDKDKTIGTKDNCEGSLLTLSFHVKQERVIKCYLYWNGQMIRFMPDDIAGFLPTLFNPKLNTMKEKLKKEIIADMKKKLIDDQFNAFIASYTN